MSPVFWLVLHHAVRFLRRPTVVQSLVLPAALAVGTLLVTLVVLAVRTPEPTLALSALPPDLATRLAEQGITPVTSIDPHEAFVRHEAGMAWDGTTLWAPESVDALRSEVALRQYLHAAWVPVAYGGLPGPAEARQQSATLSRVLAVLFVLYGTVFGVAVVHRDREDGSLDAELASPVAAVTPGLARWAAATGILTLFASASVAQIEALLGAVGAVFHAQVCAAIAVSVALGIAVSASGRPMSRDLSTALAVTAVLLGLGAWTPHVPIASVVHPGPSSVPLLLAVPLCAAGLSWFAWRIRA